MNPDNEKESWSSTVKQRSHREKDKLIKEMTEVLKEVEEFLKIICEVICPNNPPPHGNEILERMREALSKAQGGE